jgi:hypothetical protein
MRIILEDAKPEHLIEAKRNGMGWEDWSDLRLKYLPIIGYVGRNEAGDFVGLGVIAWLGNPTDGLAVGCFHLRDEYRATAGARWVHRRALKLLAAMLTITPKVHATADGSIPGAARWLERLGFVRVDGDEWVRWRDGAGNTGDHCGGVGTGLVRDPAAAIEGYAESRYG